jgi:simple sugar transport system ATP-binding protein
VANDHIDIGVRPGEVLALLGENGAGKTTLMNVLYGLLRPDEGEILVGGRPAELRSPRQAIDLGIGMVHQHFMLVPAFSVAENVVLGMHKKTGAVISKARLNSSVREFAHRYNFDLDPERRVGDLPVGLQQRVEILKSLYRGAQVLILDEPTAVLTPQEIAELFKVVRHLQSEGKSVIFISHKLNEVMEISQRIAVLRLGKVQGSVETAKTSSAELARMMIGRDLAAPSRSPGHTGEQPVLSIKGLTVKRGEKAACADLSLDVWGGEIVGLAGVDGNGQKELVEGILGVAPVAAGRVTLDGRDITGKSPARVIDAGLALVPEDRQVRGLVMDFSIAENLILEGHRVAPFRRGAFIDDGRVNRYAQGLVKDFDIRTGGGPSAPVSSLSGGNQQKVVLAREISRDPKALVVMKPTRGLDVGATEYVHKRLLEERAKGKAILLVSTELEEIMDLSDRIAVMHRGELTGLVWPDVGQEDLGQMMTGAKTIFTAPAPKGGGNR